MEIFSIFIWTVVMYVKCIYMLKNLYTLLHAHYASKIKPHMYPVSFESMRKSIEMLLYKSAQIHLWLVNYTGAKETSMKTIPDTFLL